MITEVKCLRNIHRSRNEFFDTANFQGLVAQVKMLRGRLNSHFKYYTIKPQTML